MSNYIHGVHDVNGAYLMDSKPGWVTITKALGSDPNDKSGSDYTDLTSRGFGVIVRMNNGYHPVGTIPDPAHYEDFAIRCGNYVRSSRGIDVAIIGNEPNHRNERPYNQLITPTQYAKCFDLCYTQIRNQRHDIQVAIAAVAPWDATTTYPGNPIGDWVVYYIDILQAISKCDAIAIHTYTHGPQPALITDERKIDPPFHNLHYNFPAYRDFLVNTPQKYQSLPFYITETDQVDPWKNENSGWVQKAYEEINSWNQSVTEPRIYCLCLYRSNQDDIWSIATKDQVQADFRAAVEKGYRVPDYNSPPNPAPKPPIQPPVIEVPDASERYIDPTLIARGVNFGFVIPKKGEGYWKIVNAVHLNEAEADAAGPDHHILGTITKDGKQIEDVPFFITWPSDNTIIKSKKDQIRIEYNYDYPMTSSLNEFGIQVYDGNPSDLASGIGMGANGNPSIHTSTWIDWVWAIGEGIVEPIPPVEPPVSGKLDLRHPLPGSVITQHFYQNAEDYERFGPLGHDGTDLAGKDQGTPVSCIADGIVAWVDFDTDYGNYIRIKHQDERMMCYTMYCHLQTLSPLREGDTVRAGEEVGKLGGTGNSTGIHLHLEVRLMEKDGTYQERTPMIKGRVDPETFLAERRLKL